MNGFNERQNGLFSATCLLPCWRSGKRPIRSGAGQKDAPVMIPELDITIPEGQKRFGNRFISVTETVSKPFYPFQNRFGTDNNDRVEDINGPLGTKDKPVRSRSQDEYMPVLPKYARQY